MCLALGGEALAAQTLEAYLDVFTHHYLQSKQQLLVRVGGAAYQRPASLRLQK
jgi:hypothetical protein